MAEPTRDVKQARPENSSVDKADRKAGMKDMTFDHTEDPGADAGLLVNNNTSMTLKDNADNKEENRAGDNSEEHYDVPIDRGYAWVIVGACFGMHVLVLGGLKSFGVLFLEFKDKYDVTARELGMIQGLAMTMMLALGLGANVLAVRFTCQKVVFIGGILSSLGFVLSAYIPGFGLLYLTYSVITGLGFALSYSPCVVMVGIHFKQRRSLANGISLSGSGVGSFVLPNLMRWMLKEYGLSGCLLLLGGLMLNVCVCALLFRPLNSYRRIKRLDKNYQKDVIKNGTDGKHLLNDSKEKTLQLADNDKSHLQMTGYLTQEGKQQNSNLQEKAYCEFSSSEFIPIASLQSIPREELENMTSGLCARLKCANCKDRSGNKKPKKGQKLFNWSLLSNPLFLIYAVSCALGNFAYPNIFLMLPAYAESNGQDRDTAALLVSIIGITDLVGRLFFGWFSDLKLFPKRYGFIGCMAISAFLNLVAPVMTSFAALVAYSALYGLFAGSYLALVSVMLADSLGVEKLSSAYGLVMLFMSFGLLPGPLICGGIHDATSKWDYAFILCGILALLGSIPPLFEPCAKRVADAKEERKVRKAKLIQSSP